MKDDNLNNGNSNYINLYKESSLEENNNNDLNKHIEDFLNILAFDNDKSDEENSIKLNNIAKNFNLPKDEIYIQQYFFQFYSDLKEEDKQNFKTNINKYYNNSNNNLNSLFKNLIISTFIFDYSYLDIPLIMSEYKDKISKIDTLKNEMDKIDNLKNEIDKITPQFISLIAIFTSIAFLLFGGMSFLNELLSKFSDTDEFKIIFIVSVWGLAFSFSLYIVMYFIFCLVGKEYKLKKINTLVAISTTILISFITFSIKNIQ